MVTRPFIETRTTFFDDKDEEARQRRIQRLLVRKGLPIVRDWTPRGSVQAEVNHGRWIVRCPNCAGGAEFADSDWPLFVCCSEGCGVGPFEVVFPLDREGLEGELLKRPDGRNRNWLPGEDRDSLQRENRERGVS